MALRRPPARARAGRTPIDRGRKRGTLASYLQRASPHLKSGPDYVSRLSTVNIYVPPAYGSDGEKMKESVAARRIAARHFTFSVALADCRVPLAVPAVLDSIFGIERRERGKKRGRSSFFRRCAARDALSARVALYVAGADRQKRERAVDGDRTEKGTEKERG